MKVSALRAMARLACRDIRRNHKRSALVLTMIALPIFGMTVVGTFAVTRLPTAEEAVTGAMGTADLGFSLDGGGPTPADVAEAFPGATVTIRSMWGAETVVGGTLRYISVEDVSPSDPVLGLRYRMLSGVAPTLASEVAVSPDVLASFGAQVGDTVELGRDGEAYRIVGVVITPESLYGSLALVSPGSLSNHPDSWRVAYVDLPQGVSEDEAVATMQGLGVNGFEMRTMSYGWTDQSGDGLNVIAAVTAALLAETGLIAAAAFVVGTRRQMRTVGIVGAVGGEPRHTRALVLAGGAALGFAGSVVGLVLGIVFCQVLVMTHLLDSLAGRVMDHMTIPPALPIVAIALGTAAATLAAFVPARAAARVDVMSALAGRMPPPKPAGIIARWGLVTSIVGVAITAWATTSTNTRVLTLGLFLTVGGLLLAIPLLVGWVGRLSTRFPLGIRIAARDTGRSGRRTGAAVAAATVALLAPIAFSTATLSSEAADRADPQMEEDQLFVFLPEVNRGLPPIDMDAFMTRLRDEALPGSIGAVMSYTVYSDDWGLPPGGDPFGAWVLGPEVEVSSGGETYWVSTGASMFIGGHDLLSVMHAEDFEDELDAGYVVALAPNLVDGGVVRLFDPSENQDMDPAKLELRAVDASAGIAAGGNSPQLIVSPERAAEIGLVPYGLDSARSSQMVVRATGPITPEQLTAAKSVAAEYPGAWAYGLADTWADSGPFRAIFLAFTALIALAIIAVAVALVAEESRRDRAILSAIGASPRTRRVVDGSRALILAALAGVLAVPAGFVPVTVINMANGNGKPIIVPWLAIVAVAVVLPLVAGAAAGLFSRPIPTARLLRPLE